MTPTKADRLLTKAATTLVAAVKKLEGVQRELHAWQRHNDEDDAFDLDVELEPVNEEIERAQETLAKSEWVE